MAMMLRTFEYDLELERLARAGEAWIERRVDRVDHAMRRFRRAERRDRKRRKRARA